MTDQRNGVDIDRDSKDEVHRRLGRNLLLFQTAEKRLKWLAERMHVSGMSNELEGVIEKTRRDVAKDTLGGARRRAIEGGTITEKQQGRGAGMMDGRISASLAKNWRQRCRVS